MSDAETLDADLAPVHTQMRTPIGALLHYWPLAVVLGLIGVVAGVVAASDTATSYTAEARVAVGAGDLTSGAIAGFPLAASELASNYARYVSDGGLVSAHQGVSVSASQIPSSNVIRIEGVSTDKAAVVQQTQSAAQDLVTEVNKENRGGANPDLLDQFEKAAATWSQAQTQQSAAQDAFTLADNSKPAVSAAVLRAAKARLTTTTSALTIAELKKDTLATQYQAQESASTSANLLVIDKASISSSDRSSRLQCDGLLGLVAGVVLALIAAVFLEQRGNRTMSRRRSTTA